MTWTIKHREIGNRETYYIICKAFLIVPYNKIFVGVHQFQISMQRGEVDRAIPKGKQRTTWWRNRKLKKIKAWQSADSWQKINQNENHKTTQDFPDWLCESTPDSMLWLVVFQLHIADHDTEGAGKAKGCKICKDGAMMSWYCSSQAKKRLSTCHGCCFRGL